MNIYKVIIILVIYSKVLNAQGTAGSGSVLEPRYIVDMPTAGILGHLKYAVDVDFYNSGGVTFGFSMGLLNAINLGFSYGGKNIIGSDKPDWYKLPGMSLKIRPLDEREFLPAVVIGFDSQGKEEYIDSLSRYKIKSPGIYVVFSKNFLSAGYLSFHLGSNYSLERADMDKDFNTFLGIEKTITKFISVIAEYNLAINDSNKKALGKGKGYLNLAIRASVGNDFTIGVNFKDVTGNQKKVSIANRTISVEFISSL